MAWNPSTSASAGAYLMASVTSGFNLDLFGSVPDAELAARVTQYANGWTVTGVQIERGLFGLGSTFRVFGRAAVDVSTDHVAAQVEQALNSFWTIGGVRVAVLVSTTLSTPPTTMSEWSDTLQMVALAAVVVGVVYGLTQLRKAIA